MPKDHSGCIRAFHQLSAAYYGRRALADRYSDGHKVYDELDVGMYDPNGGGTSGEFTIEWIELSGRVVPRLQAFDDSWSALLLFRDLFEAMARATDLLMPADPLKAQTASLFPDQVIDIAKRLGIKDLTKRDDPYAPRAQTPTLPGDWRKANR